VAHELAHVVQNLRGGHTSGYATSEVDRKGSANEREADRVSRMAASGHTVEVEEHGGDGLHLDEGGGHRDPEKYADELLHLTANISSPKERIIALATRLSKELAMGALEKAETLQRLAGKLHLSFHRKETPQSVDLDSGHCAFRILRGLATVLYGLPDPNKKGQYHWRELI
jgi:hypothetical protein